MQGGAFGCNHRQEFVPGFDERSSPFILESACQGVEVDAGLPELSQDCFAITAIGRQDAVNFAVIGEGFQGGLRHCVNRQWRGQRLDVKDVRGLGIFGSRAGEQEPLRASAGIEDTFPTRRTDQVAVGFVGAFSNGDTKLVVERRYLAPDGGIPATNDSEATEPTRLWPAAIRRSTPRR